MCGRDTAVGDVSQSRPAGEGVAGVAGVGGRQRKPARETERSYEVLTMRPGARGPHTRSSYIRTSAMRALTLVKLLAS